MLRRILLRLLPHSSQPSNKFSPVFRQRTTVATLKPSLYIFLGVSAATFATVITIHGDSAQTPKDNSVQILKSPAHKYIFPKKVPPSPTADETFDLSSESGIRKEKAVGISQVDTILLARCVTRTVSWHLFRPILIPINSNQPCEDVFSQEASEFSSTLNYSLFGVYDGHNGSLMSNFLGETLIDAVLGQLHALYSKHAAPSNSENTDDGGSFSFRDTVDGAQQPQSRLGLIKGLHERTYPSEKEIDWSIKKAFLLLDSLAVDELTNLVLDKRLSKEEGIRLLSLPRAGSCALLGIYNNVKRTFKVAVTGDSRAILGRRVALKDDDTYAYETHVLSADHNAHNPHEVKRLEAAHPGEKIFENGRTLGWGMSRAFGDAACKWSLEIQQRLHEEYLGDRIRSNCLTPPYFTAEPDITTTTIQKGDFVVMASDGLWDCLTNEEVVGLVGGWLETRGEEVKIGRKEGIGEGERVVLPFGKPGPSGQDPKKGFGKGRGNGWPEGLNGGGNNEVVKENGDTIWERTDLPVTSIKPDETLMYNWWRATKRFVNIDGNSAVHLARNALGGANRDLTGALLRLRPPRSRRYR